MKNQLSTPNSVAELNLCRERSREEVNEFLEHDLVNHQLGSIPGWKAAFGARYEEKLIAI